MAASARASSKSVGKTNLNAYRNGVLCRSPAAAALLVESARAKVIEKCKSKSVPPGALVRHGKIVRLSDDLHLAPEVVDALLLQLKESTAFSVSAKMSSYRRGGAACRPDTQIHVRAAALEAASLRLGAQVPGSALIIVRRTITISKDVKPDIANVLLRELMANEDVVSEGPDTLLGDKIWGK